MERVGCTTLWWALVSRSSFCTSLDKRGNEDEGDPNGRRLPQGKGLLGRMFDGPLRDLQLHRHLDRQR